MTLDLFPDYKPDPFRVAGLSPEMCRCIIALREGPLVWYPWGYWQHDGQPEEVRNGTMLPVNYFRSQTIYALCRRKLARGISLTGDNYDEFYPRKVELIEELKHKTSETELK